MNALYAPLIDFYQKESVNYVHKIVNLAYHWQYVLSVLANNTVWLQTSVVLQIVNVNNVLIQPYNMDVPNAFKEDFYNYKINIKIINSNVNYVKQIARVVYL